MCVLGERLLKDIPLENCTKDAGSPLWDLFCDDPVTMTGCDSYFQANNVSLRRGIKGLASGVFFGE
jgi:solute carrier family 12 (potassium/chloride transporter), member 4/6